MNLLEALELVASLVPGLGPAVRAIRLLRIAVRIAECLRRTRRFLGNHRLDSYQGRHLFNPEALTELDDAIDELEREECGSAASSAKGCWLDTDGDGNCNVHPEGCPPELRP